MVFSSVLFKPDNRNMRESAWTGFRSPDGADSSVQRLNFPIWSLFDHFDRMKRPVNGATSRKIPAICGAGFYFRLLLLAMGDIESNPGPSTSDKIKENLQKTKLELSEMPEMQQDVIQSLQIYLEGKELKAANEEEIDGIRESVRALAASVSKKSEQIDKLIQENSTLKTRVSQLENKIAKQEADLRRKNAIVFGVPTESNLKAAIDDVLFEKLSLEKRPQEEIIDSAFRIGRPEGEKRPILIRFKSDSDKARVMQHVHKLKGTNIGVSHYRTPEEQQQRRVLVGASKAASQHGLSAKIRRRGIELDGKFVTLAEVCEEGWLQRFLSKVPPQSEGERERTKRTSSALSLEPRADGPAAGVSAPERNGR
ncbi:protein unc-13 homolog C isoform X1 [Neocloeon triangulifer]|uniref:protein unc-13 homolog C isoform X1 n=1 Tax=Neocloeon triangulifer TaxID=2078957 RepID=UPI00286F05E6|nr:protein unc-13 homolog C isoform X1 [Neocloeon triangulifer]